MRLTFYVVIGALVLAVIGASLPLLDCRVCDLPDVDVWHSKLLVCPVCEDRGKVSAFRRMSRRPLHPQLAMIVSGRGTMGAGIARQMLLSANGVEGARAFEHVSVRLGFPRVQESFIDTEAGLRFLLVLTGHRGMFSWRHPHPFPGRILLFDEEARLLDRWEVVPSGERQSVDFVDGQTSVVLELIPRLEEALPAGAGLGLLIEGKETRRFGTSLRIDVRSGRLAVAP